MGREGRVSDYVPSALNQRELVAAIREVLWVAEIAIAHLDDQLLDDAREELRPLALEYLRRVARTNGNPGRSERQGRWQRKSMPQM